ncbi:MAG: PqqD family protein [Bacteroidales bacterium]|nr:PqqD family protein [Bacteroidales bacterium]
MINNSKSQKIHSSSLLQRSNKQLISKIDQEIVMLSIENEAYYLFNSVGTVILQYLKFPIHYQELIENIINEYDVSLEVCEHETRIYLESLLKYGLIEIINDESTNIN